MNSQNTLQLKAHFKTYPFRQPIFRIIRGGLFSLPPQENNWVFIDGQNVHTAVKQSGWKINWGLFRSYLADVHNVTRAVIFLGRIERNAWLYKKLEDAGFVLVFRKVKVLKDGSVDGGNVDADISCYAMDHKREYTKAILVADDGDYAYTLGCLDSQNKLKLVISSHTIAQSSDYVKEEIGTHRMLSIHSIRHLIEYKQKLVP